MDTFTLIQTLTETPGPSGFEADIAAVIHEVWRPLVDDIEIDRVGSLIARKKGGGDIAAKEENRPSIMLAAHMDEIGLLVTRLIDHKGHGFLRVTNLGGVDIRHLYGQRVTVHGTNGGGPNNLPGVLGAAPDSLQPAKKRNKPYDFEALVVDVGLPFDELSQLVSIGDAITFHQPLRKLQNGRITGKALDNRLSIAAVTICLEALQTRRHDWDVIALASCQEETRLLGAATSAYRIEPDIALAIDVTFGRGPGSTDWQTTKLDGGPAIMQAPDVHPGIHQGLKTAAKRLELKTQLEIAPRPGGTDAYELQVARAGIPTGVVSIPLRYMHTMVETATIKDVERVGRLLTEYICGLDENTKKSLSKLFLDEDHE